MESVELDHAVPIQHLDPVVSRTGFTTSSCPVCRGSLVWSSGVNIGHACGLVGVLRDDGRLWYRRILTSPGQLSRLTGAPAQGAAR